jgi:DtxR family transcriptional regulator, Mn-dependent transcriptional regulator
MGGYHPAAEQYLETIYELEESGVAAMRARIVERLGVSAPSVSETVKRLEREGYLTLDDQRVMHLTESGRHLATAIARRHRLAERLLVDVIKVPWHQVHEEAGRLEHAISENLEQHLVRLLDDPGTCPHGNPIPGSRNLVDVGALTPLGDLRPGDRAVVRRVDEEVEADAAHMLRLEQLGLLPGVPVSVVAVDDESASVRTAAAEGRLPAHVAARLYVSDVEAGSAGRTVAAVS